jgi:hypothetical protein
MQFNLRVFSKPANCVSLTKQAHSIIRRETGKLRSDDLIGFGAEPDHCDNCEDNEERENYKLRELEWLLGLGGGHRRQRGYFFERLHNTNEHIKIERNHSANDVNPAPISGELTRIPRINRYRQDQ